MRAHVGKIVDADPKSTGHLSKGIAHLTFVLAKIPSPRAFGPRQNNVHRAARADGALELAAALSDRAAVSGSDEPGVHVASEKRLLHEMNYSHSLT